MVIENLPVLACSKAASSRVFDSGGLQTILLKRLNKLRSPPENGHKEYRVKLIGSFFLVT
jgi:hypothetical protein